MHFPTARNMRNYIVRIFICIVGIFLIATDTVFIYRSNMVLGPWDVLHQGLAKHTPISFGVANIVVGVFVLVVAVIFLFLGRATDTLIPAVALPLSLLLTFIAMRALGYSLDNLSLMALTLAIGFLVDDAIVFLENTVRRMERGEGALAASINGAREISFTILSMTISLAAVFIPLLFMGGILGRLFREFSITIGVSVLVSGFVSLTLTPMLCSRFLRPPHEQRHGRFYNAIEGAFDRSLRLYEVGLRWSLRHRLTLAAGSLAVLAATAWLFVAIPKGFIPEEDTGQMIAFTEAIQGVSFEALAQHQQQLGPAGPVEQLAQRHVKQQPQGYELPIDLPGARQLQHPRQHHALLRRLHPTRPEPSDRDPPPQKRNLWTNRNTVFPHNIKPKQVR